MKRPLVCIAVLLLTCSMAGSAEPTPNGAPVADSGLGGGCFLPDLAGLSPDQISAVALEAGLLISANNVAVPACPVTFGCSSLAGCSSGPACVETDDGPCCTKISGIVFCCPAGTSIKVRRCSCVCTGNPCAAQCTQSTNVTWSCA